MYHRTSRFGGKVELSDVGESEGWAIGVPFRSVDACKSAEGNKSDGSLIFSSLGLPNPDAVRPL